MIDPSLMAAAEAARNGGVELGDFDEDVSPAEAIAAMMGPQAGELIENGQFREMATQLVSMLLAPFANGPHWQAATEILTETVALEVAGHQATSEE